MVWPFQNYTNGFKFSNPPDIFVNLDGAQLPLPLQADWTHAFPTLKDLAKLSEHVYSIPKLREDEDFSMEDRWECIATGVHKEDGYCGAAYLNKTLSQIVIAHKGTSSLKDVFTDWKGVVLNKNPSQISTAYIFTKLVVNQFHDKVFSISVTGHSLGGWLAQICTLYIEYPELISGNPMEKDFIDKKEEGLTKHDSNLRQFTKSYKPYHLHAVVFDSPGCRSALLRIIGGRYIPEKKVEFKVKIESLDITVVIAPSNIVNTHGEHVGQVIHLPIQGVPEYSRITNKSHGITRTVEYLSSDMSVVVLEVYDARRGKSVEYENALIHRNWYIGHFNSCRVNIFSSHEQEFLRCAQRLLQWEKDHKDGRGNQLETNIFNSKDNTVTRFILGTLQAHELNNIILGLKIEHELMYIEAQPQDGDNYVIPNFIWRLKKLLKDWENGDWDTNTVLAKTIKILPTCVQAICQMAGLEYLKLIPELCDEPQIITPGSLAATIKEFLENDTHRILNLTTSGEGKRRTRMSMVHIAHCLRNGLGGVSKESILFLSTSHLQSLVKSVGIKFKESKLELLVVECDSEINPNVMETIAREVILILVFNSNEQMYCPNVNSFSKTMSFDFDLTILYENLTKSAQNVLKGCSVDIQGQIVSLGRIPGELNPFLLDNMAEFFNALSPLTCSELICDIFDGEWIELVGGNLPKMADHYIPRRFYEITLDISKLKNSGFSDVIVVSDYEGDSIRSHVGDILFNKIVWREGAYSKEQFFRDYDGHPNAHWFKQGKGALIWQTSTGPPCSKYLIDEAGETEELHILNLPNDMIVLADEPGMGKSASIINLFLEHREFQKVPNNSAYNLGVYIDLHDLQLDLKNCEYSDELVSKFLTKVMKVEGEISSKILHFLLEKSGPITFFIDSFDEISKSGQDFIVKLLKKLKSGNKYLRILIATRNYAKDELEIALETKAYRFYRVSTDEQILFLGNYWMNGFVVDNDVGINLRPESYTLLPLYIAFEFGRRAVQAIKSLLGEEDTFIGIPLQLVILATIYSDKFQELANTAREQFQTKNLEIPYYPYIMLDSDWEKFSHKFSSTLELYKEFVNRKLEIWLDEKLRFERRTRRLDEKQKSWMNEMLCQAAYLHLSSSHFKSSICPLPTESLNEEDCDDINRAGLCETTVEWRKAIKIPQNLLKRLRKTGNVQNAESSNIVFLTLRDNSVYNNEQVKRLLKGFISAEIVFGNENEFNKLCSDHMTVRTCKQIHWFVEDNNSNCLFVKFFNSENRSSEFSDPDPTVSKSYEVSNYSYRFIHQTLAEYFMAKFLVSLIDKGRQDKDDAVGFLKLHYHEEYFRKIRYFLDSFLCKDIPALENLEIFQIPNLILKFDEGLSENDWTREDSLGRNILHYAVAYGNYFIDGIFWMIAKNLELFHKKDKLDASCLSYLLLSDHIRHMRFYFYYLNLDTNRYLRNSSLCPPLKPMLHQIGFNDDKYDHLKVRSELFYSVFIGTIYCSACSDNNSLSRYISDQEREERKQIGDVSYTKFIDKLNEASSQLKKKLEINIRWLLNCNWHRVKTLSFLNNLFLHNSLDTLSDTMDINLSEWLRYCLDEENQRGYTLVADILYCYGSRRYGSAFWGTEINVNDRVYSKLKENLEVNYDNLFQYMTPPDEYRLWKSCTDNEKRIMFKIIKKNKFYSILRVGTWAPRNPRAVASFIDVLTRFIESDNDSSDLKNALVWAFQIGKTDNKSTMCRCIWNASDECTRKRLVNDNIKYVGPNEKQSALPISDDDYGHIFSGKNVNWKILSKTCLDTTNNIFVKLRSHFQAKQLE